MVYQLRDVDENVVDGGFSHLPTILPGVKPWEQTVEWKTEQAHALEVALLTPQMNKVLDTVIMESPFLPR